jgi:hypothetical protein
MADKTADKADVKPAPKAEPKPPDKTADKADVPYNYPVYCKGVGGWTWQGTGPNQSAEAQAAYLAHFGIISTDHTVVVGEPEKA